MSGCGRQFCKVCKEEVIHRDHRKGYESASALGQIIWREGPDKLAFADADGISLKLLRDGDKLLRVIEQKQPGHTLGWAQDQILRLLDAVIVHCRLCPMAAELHLDQRSGVYIVRGLIAAADSPRKQTTFDGPQTIERLHDGDEKTYHTHEEFFWFLDPQDASRRRKKAA